MCGIIGFIGKTNNNVSNIILDGLFMLQNRGYDSIGISYLDHTNSSLLTIKKASTLHNPIDYIKDHFKPSNNPCSVIGHTRWATHGAKTDNNAHPHNDCENIFSIVHNGIIENYKELKETYLTNYTFSSQTDTEVICALLYTFYKSTNDVTDAMNKTLSVLKGTWALSILCSHIPNKMWISKNGSPLLVSINDDFAIITSEQSGFCNYVTHYNELILEPSNFLEITYDGKIQTNISLNTSQYQTNVDTNDVNGICAPFKHFLEKEIMLQDYFALNALNNGGRIESDFTVKLGGLERCKDELLHCKHLILLGCGTSYNAGLWALKLFKMIEVFESVNLYDASELTKYDLPKDNYCTIMLSQSGETRDLIKCFDVLENSINIGVVNVVNSEISKRTSCGVYLNAGKEISVASTKSFTNQCIVLSLISVWFSQNKGTHSGLRKQIIHDLRNISYDIKCVLNNINKVNELVQYFNHSSLFLLGKSFDYAIAKEGSLKLKEVSYKHAEGYNSGALKHGPFALIDETVSTIIIDTCSEYHDANINALNEIQSRMGTIIYLSNTKDSMLPINRNITFGSLLVNVYIQYLSYLLGIKNGHNPDFPKNLAKVVTVD